MTKKAYQKVDTYQKLTDHILALLEKGIVPWHKPWAVDSERPCNGSTNKPYNGINLWLLGSHEYSTDVWLTFNQMKKLGGHLKAEEKSQHFVVFWKFLKKNVINEETGQSETKTIPFFKHSAVFNLDQTECVKLPKKVEIKLSSITTEKKDHDNNKICEDIISGYSNSPEIKFTGNRACYNFTSDKINVPELSKFDSPEEFYGTVFHELVHSTGHESRLNRDLKDMGKEPYSKEELVAEMDNVFLCAKAGISNATINNSASYLNGWMMKISEDKRLIVSASSKAKKAIKLILNEKEEYAA